MGRLYDLETVWKMIHHDDGLEIRLGEFYDVGYSAQWLIERN